MNDGSASRACEFAVCDLDFSLPARAISRDESWEIEFTCDNMNVIIAYLKSSASGYDEHNVFVSEQDRRNGKVVVPAGSIRSTGNVQVWQLLFSLNGHIVNDADCFMSSPGPWCQPMSRGVR
jgi:hypothetical protein